MDFEGPYLVMSQENDFDYKVIANGKGETFHVNLLRKYVEINKDEIETELEDVGDVEQVYVSVIEEVEVHERRYW